MPPVVQPAMTDTTLPGATRRRVWAAPEVRSHSLVVMTFGKIYLSPVAGTPKPETVSALENGADVEALLGPSAMAIDLAMVRQIRLDLVTNTLTIDYLVGQGSVSRLRVAIGFATSEAADTVFTKLWRRLGEGFDLTPVKPDLISIVRTPLAALGGVIAATAALALTLSSIHDFVSPGTLDLPEWLDWRVVCGLGGVVMAILQIWLYRRYTRPPVRLELVRRG